MDELTKEFLAESFEGLDRMDRCLTELESRPNDGELLAEIFRSVHTIKGTTGFLGFSRLEKLAHAGEHLLGLLRDGELKVEAELVSGLLQLMDRLREILRLIEKLGKEGNRAQDDDTLLIALLEKLARAGAAEGGPAGVETTIDKGALEAAQTGRMLAEAARSTWNASTPSAGGIVQAEAATGAVTPKILVNSGSPAASVGGVSEKTLRIDVDVLNRMMNLVGELVLTRNQLLQSHVDATNFSQLTRRLDSVTADLRETVMQARMQPVGHLFGRFPRMVRDLARSCGKMVRVEFSGQETGLDKSLLEAIKDPLTHAIRNAIDHGIEEPHERVLAGKAMEGRISLRAFHQSGSVVIEVADDGGGISTGRVLAKALERRLLTEEQAATMTEREALQMIFLPGFSTATKITHVSGRGVGMDVVRANVEKVGGTVELESHEGQGTVLRLRVPLTLAIVPALVVRSGGQSFCLPQGSLAELVYVPAREAESAVERIGQAELYRLRDRLLPLVWLDRLLCLEGVRQQEHGFYLAVLEAEGCRFGLVVDDLMAPEEIVVKPLSAVLRGIGLFSGATVLGNGTLAMILDVQATAARAGIRPVPEVGEQAKPAEVAEAVKGTSFLIFEDRVTGPRPERKALPLQTVERIESVLVHEVEYAGDKPLLQYHGELLPLEDAGGLLQARSPEDELTILICLRPPSNDLGETETSSQKRFGMVVLRVIDVAGGLLLDEDADLCAGRLALVKDQLTVIHKAFAREEHWKAVA